MYGQRCVSRVYQVESQFAGLVIGAKGAGIRELRDISGVVDVKFVARRDSETSPLTVKATSEGVCEEVYNAIQEKIRSVDRKKMMFTKAPKPPVTQIFIEIKENMKIRLKPKSEVQNSKIITRDARGKEIFLFSKYECLGLEDGLSSLQITNDHANKMDWLQFSERDLIDSLNRSFSKMNKEERKAFDFNMTPGKFTFIGNNERGGKQIIPNRCGNIAKEAFKAINVAPVYSNALKKSLYPEVTKNLQLLGFSNLNSGSPEQFTIVHLLAGDNQERFSVVLALDENLEELSQKSDSRLSDEKKKAIENVFKAKTIIEVMGNTHMYPKIAFHKLSLLLHPDKNSHPGSTDAFKKLQHAYQEMTAGKSHSTNALNIGKVPATKANVIRPPKVISVKVQKRKVANITFFTSNILDMRMALTTFKEDPNKLTNHVKDVLNECWDNRDPDGKSGIYIQCLKQVTAGHIWVKPIETKYGEAILELKIKEMREKVENQKDWQECVEIDMTIIMEENEKERLEAEKLASYILEIRQVWDALVNQ
eukprot:GFUD01000587.1.p1 GENE.GFUD01000587.1~~GFUD01000587.1.p1  ORF type:complete len:544 (+),score=139.17 GFUD01000587.1:25-1632(+)